MVYRVIGLMSGSSLDGLDIVFAEFQGNAGSWNYEIIHADCYSYSEGWISKLKNACFLNALDYQLLHTEYGHYLGQQVNRFIDINNLYYKVALIASHGHTTFHVPSKKMTSQLGEGAAIAAETELPVVTDLRSLDVAFGGQGAPIVPIGEKLLMPGYIYFLNLGGIANISAHFSNELSSTSVAAFDVCPANKVLNMLANDGGKEYDDAGRMAQAGNIYNELLNQLNELDYYNKPFPKSLSNDFGIDTIYSLIKNSGITIQDALRTYVEHISIQIKNAISALYNHKPRPTGSAGRAQTPSDRVIPAGINHKLLITGGGAFNTFLLERLQSHLHDLNVQAVLPEEKLVKYKEALIMAFIGVLRWRQEYNTLSSVTGASRDTIGGALWIGQEA